MALPANLARQPVTNQKLSRGSEPSSSSSQRDVATTGLTIIQRAQTLTLSDGGL
jgi:hypothetical protein